MLKKEITWKDPETGEEYTRAFYFNLSKGEIIEMELRENLQGGMRKQLQDIIDSNDGRRIMDVFKDIIARSYGVKGEDGFSFIKTPELQAGFLGSEPYSVLFTELITDPDAAARFINAVVPSDLSGETTGRPAPQDHQQKLVAGPPEVAAPTPAPAPDPDYAAYLAWKDSQKQGEATQSEVWPPSQD